MLYIVIERNGDPSTAYIITDESGNNKVFQTREAAEEELWDCHDGVVVLL